MVPCSGQYTSVEGDAGRTRVTLPQAVALLDFDVPQETIYDRPRPANDPCHWFARGGQHQHSNGGPEGPGSAPGHLADREARTFRP
ncbi:hypothetical protein MES5069_510012 [Mesorhizobium escarrei]|uniref:Uncharacterized protein n=1 Tax=Mesorhizobium escarrei TaxID=666018 RepID=A0ABN8K735_9HYPH|nr:hypothetical protein MES5069_510012 [Mesorhizobium escarrei]